MWKIHTYLSASYYWMHSHSVCMFTLCNQSSYSLIILSLLDCKLFACSPQFPQCAVVTYVSFKNLPCGQSISICSCSMPYYLSTVSQSTYPQLYQVCLYSHIIHNGKHIIHIRCLLGLILILPVCDDIYSPCCLCVQRPAFFLLTDTQISHSVG